MNPSQVNYLLCMFRIGFYSVLFLPFPCQFEIYFLANSRWSSVNTRHLCCPSQSAYLFNIYSGRIPIQSKGIFRIRRDLREIQSTIYSHSNTCDYLKFNPNVSKNNLRHILVRLNPFLYSKSIQTNLSPLNSDKKVGMARIGAAADLALWKKVYW